MAKPGIATFDLGAHKIGHAAINHPISALVIVILVSVTCIVAGINGMKFDGKPSKLFSGQHEEYQLLQEFSEKFGDFPNREILMVESRKLPTAQGMELLRDLVFDLQLLDGLRNVGSIFSIAEFDLKTETWSSVLPANFNDANDSKTVLEAFYQYSKAAKLLISEDFQTTLIVFNRRNELTTSLDLELQSVLERYRTSGLEVTQVGAPALEKEIVSYVRNDSVFLTGLGFLIANSIAFLLFRSIQAVIICILPVSFSLVLHLGLTSIIGLPIDLLTMIIPNLVMTLTLANTIHLFLRWQKTQSEGFAPAAALYESVSFIGPATFLAVATTGIAFITLMIASNDLLNRMAMSGMIGMVSIFLSVIVVGPIALYWFGEKHLESERDPFDFLSHATQFAVRIFDANYKLIFKLTLFAILPLIVMHFWIPSQYSLLNYLPDGSFAKSAELKLEKNFGGSDQLVISIQRQTSASKVIPGELKMLEELEGVTGRILGAKNTLSLAAILPPETQKQIELDFENTAHPLSGFISNDRQFFSLFAQIPNSRNATNFQETIKSLEREISSEFPQLVFEISGNAKMKSTIAPQIISDLRTGLIVSVLLSTLLLAFAFKSWATGIICLLPNLLPILIAESLVWVFIGSIDMTAVIALMIGYGLAMDDTVHFLNHYFKSRAAEESIGNVIHATITSVGPALIATTLIIGLGLSATLVAVTPTVALFGIMIMGILVIALLADLFVLPSAIISFIAFRQKKTTELSDQ